MAPRRRLNGNSDLPVGLSAFKKRGQERYKYRFPSGKEKLFPIGITRFQAKEAAAIFNAKNRSPNFELIDKTDTYNRPLKKILPKVISRIKKEEKLGKNALSTLNADIERLNQWFGDKMTKTINLETVNQFLDLYNNQRKTETGKPLSNNVYNRKIAFLSKIFDYLCDMSAMEKNPAKLKKSLPKEEKTRKRLNLEQYKKIHQAAPEWLQIAMELALQTTHAVLEISKIKYTDCEYFENPLTQDNLNIIGIMKIHRQKVAKKEASRVAIPITAEIKSTIDKSRNNIVSPYIVHKAKKSSNKISQNCTHWTQLTSRNISNEFSDIRDSLNIMSEIPKSDRPTFHEIRALAIHLYTEQGYNPQARAAHTDIKTTKIYQRGHVEWIQVPPAELVI